MDKYYEYLNRYYQELNSQKKCKGCKESKVFLETDGTLSFSCGGKGVCGEGFKINLSKYINYIDTLNDASQFSNKDHNISKKEKDTIMKGLEDILKLGKKQVIENNNISSKKKLIDEYDDLKIKTKIEQVKLLYDINDPKYSGAIESTELIKRYNSLNKLLNEKYKELTEKFENPVNNYVSVHKGTITVKTPPAAE